MKKYIILIFCLSLILFSGCTDIVNKGDITVVRKESVNYDSKIMLYTLRFMDDTTYQDIELLTINKSFDVGDKLDIVKLEK